jgi:type VI secretion system protein ImpH
MGPASRRPDPALIERLIEAPAAFDFFQALHLLELETAARDSAGPARQALDLDRPPAELGLRFRVLPSLAFPVQPIAAVRRLARDETTDGGFELDIACLGLIGPAGTLPKHYTAALLERLHLKDATLREFLDLLQHRSVVLFYRAGCKYRVARAIGCGSRAESAGDPLLDTLLSLVGRAAAAPQRDSVLDLRTLAHHSGLFADRRRSAEGLRSMLSGMLGCSVRVEQFLGEWVELDERARSRLGRSAGPGTQARLGEETTLGTRVWTVDSRVRVVAGPLDRRRFCELWPGSPKLRLLETLTRAYLGPLIDCTFTWELAPNAPAIQRLGSDQRLGRDAWLGWSDVARAELRVASPPGQNRVPSRS